MEVLGINISILICTKAQPMLSRTVERHQLSRQKSLDNTMILTNSSPSKVSCALLYHRLSVMAVFEEGRQEWSVSIHQEPWLI